MAPNDGGRATGPCLPGIAVMATRARSFAFLYPTNCDSGQLNFLSLWDPLLAAVVDISLTSVSHPGTCLYQLVGNDLTPCQSLWDPPLSAGVGDRECEDD